MPFGLKDNDYKLIKNVFHSISKIEEVLVFGSRAMGTEKPGSDVDLALIGNDITLNDILKLKHQLEELPIIYDFDVINYHTINTPALIEHIDRHGILFYKKEIVPNEWKTYKFGDLAELRKEQVVSNGIEQPYIGLEHIEQQTLRLNGIGSSNDVISNKFKFYAGDVLYGRLRPYFRKVFNPKFDGVCSTEIFVLKNKKIIDKSFLYYLVASEEFTNIANSGSSGTHMPRADWRQLVKSEWNIPKDIKTQLQIAQILTSLDDKIELNLQMNQTLEAMAQAIFKEWFVDFQFPGFDGELVDGLPKGWRMGKLGEILQPKRGKNITKSDAIEGIFPVVAGGLEPSCYHNESNTKEPVITISSSGANAGYVRLYYSQVWSADSCFIDNSIYSFVYYCYIFLKSNQKNIYDSQEGSAQPHIYPRHIMDLNIHIGNEKIVEHFEKTVSPIFEKIKYNNLQIQTLTQTRDSLLPRLMSGKIEVKNKQQNK